MLKRTIFLVSILFLGNLTLSAETGATETELITAINGGVKSVEKFLHKVPTYELYDYDKTILHYAVELGKYDIVEFLVSKDVDLSRKGGIYYQTALQDAIFYEHFRIAKLLINSGTPLDIQNIDGETALHIAAKNGYTEMVSLLLENGASKNIYNYSNNTPYDLVSNFTISNGKRLKEMLKPSENDVKSSINDDKNKQREKIFILDNMDYGQASFVLEEMVFDTGSSPTDNYDEVHTKGIDINIVDDTVSENSSIGDTIRSQ